MKKEPLWDLFCSKNAAMVNADSVRFTPDMLRKFFDTTYDAAHKQGGWDNSKARDKLDAKMSDIEEIASRMGIKF